MGDKKTITMARKELEEMYVGIPDDSVNLSFQDLAQVIHKKLSPSSTMKAISESGPSENIPPPLAKLPSLDFSRALHEASLNHHHHHHEGGLHHPHGHNNNHHHHHEGGLHHSHGHNNHHHHQVNVQSHHTHHQGAGFRSPAPMEQRSFTYDDMSYVSTGGGRRRRPGIPHSNICTVCSTYTYIFRHRCLVCGRVYCRQCVSIGMGEMKEGRKCMDCLGRRFSQRYINKAGNIGCCCLGYPSTVKQQELKWAEKGPRTSGGAVSRHRSGVAPSYTTTGTPTGTPPLSPYSQNSHHFVPL